MTLNSAMLVASALILIIMQGQRTLLEAQIIPLWSTALLDGVTNDTKPLQYAGHGPLLLSNCERTAQFYLYQYVYMSKDGFKIPVRPLRIPTSLLQNPDDDPVVVSAVVRSESLLVMIDSRVFIYNIHLDRFEIATGIVGHNITSLEVAKYCCKHSWCEEWSDTVIALGESWSEEHGANSVGVFVLEHLEAHFFQVDLPGDVNTRDIISAIPIMPWHQLALLMRDPDRADSAIFRYVAIAEHAEEDYDYHSFIRMSAIPFSVHGSERFTTVHLTGRFGEFLLWSPTYIFLSLTAGQTVLRIGKELSHLRTDEYIGEVAAGMNGDFTIMTTEGALWYGRGSLETVIAQLSVGELDSTSAISFDSNGNIFIMTAQRYDRSPQNEFTQTLVYLTPRIIYPSEVVDSHGFTLPPCPFLLFKVNFPSQLFYLDMGDMLTLPATYIPTPWQESPIMIYPSNPSIIRVNTSMVMGEPIGRGVNAIEVSTIVRLTADTPDALVTQHIEGVSAVTFTTAISSLTCLKNPSLQAFIAAGCPPDKTIKYRKQVHREQCDYLKNYIYTFQRDEYDPTFMEGTHGVSDDQGDLTIQYDYGTHGCPDMSYYSDGFKPQFDLYIGDEFIEEMNVDYALIEVHGVHNYEYSLNSKKAGCTRKPQSWVDMLVRQNGTSDPNTAWNRHNYESCIGEGGGGRLEERYPYQVMNAHTDNKILWRQIKAIYIFNVTVLDPKYSYCNLHTQFAVEVYGALPPSKVSELRVTLITCLVGLAGVVVIFGYYLLRKRGEEGEEQEASRIPQFPH